MADTVLDGCRVLELADEKVIFCGKLLAEMGAEVVHIEKPGQGTDRTSVNAGKRSISLDIEKEEGRELFRRLAGISDIVIEGFAPGYLEKLGIDYRNLSSVSPRIIMASITHFGQTGPYRDYKSSALVSAALGGQVLVCGDRDRPPLKPFGPQAYYTACLFAACGIMLALRQRHDTVRGQYIDISVHECTAATLDHQLVRYLYQGVAAERTGSLYWNNAFRIFPCKDGYILLSLMHQWETLVEWLDAEGMAQDLKQENWQDEETRHRNVAHIIEVLEKWTLNHNTDELVETGQLMHFPWARIASMADVLENPQLNARGFFIRARDEDTGRQYKHPGAPFIMSRSPLRISPSIPAAGEYTGELLHNGLGLPAAEMEELARLGVINT
ncbi:MAG: CoA transferase [Dehalococcoidales bacterium]|nr:CoA transferase [Dehalococcoidales bacterium]